MIICRNVICGGWLHHQITRISVFLPKTMAMVPRQVGHTGDLKAVVRACTTVDRHLGDLLETVEKMGGRWLVSSDHGNADDMVQARGGDDSCHASCWNSCYNPRGVKTSLHVLKHGRSRADAHPHCVRVRYTDQPSARWSGRCMLPLQTARGTL